MRPVHIIFFFSAYLMWSLLSPSPGAFAAPLPTPRMTVAQGPVTPEPSTAPEGATLYLSGKKLFTLYGTIGPYSPRERAKNAEARLKRFVADEGAPIPSISYLDGKGKTEILLNGETVITVMDEDAMPLWKDRAQVARDYGVTMRIAIEEARRQALQEKEEAMAATVKKEEQLKREELHRKISRGIMMTIVYSLAYLLLLGILVKGAALLSRWLHRQRGKTIRTLRIQKLEILREDRILAFLLFLTGTLRLAGILLLSYFCAYLVLSSFPSTQAVAMKLTQYGMAFLAAAGMKLLSYLPNLLVIVLTVVVTCYAFRFVNYIFSELAGGSISIPGFYEDWVEPTRKIALFLLVTIALVVAVPYLPGYESPAFKGLSLFFGILFSLGSTTAISNIVAGVLLTYTSAFRLGDRVKIGDVTGDIVERAFLVIRIQTIKNEIISIPNSSVLTQYITNYSSVCRGSDCTKGTLILHTTVTIGYDAPWRTVHRLLIEAATGTAHVLAEPSPFVYQKSLDDNYVSYELNAYTTNPHAQVAIYSELHQNIQDRFNEAGVEIMSPHYRAIRDGNEVTIPAPSRAGEYEAPAFRVRVDTGAGK